MARGEVVLFFIINDWRSQLAIIQDSFFSSLIPLPWIEFWMFSVFGLLFIDMNNLLQTSLYAQIELLRWGFFGYSLKGIFHAISTGIFAWFLISFIIYLFSCPTFPIQSLCHSPFIWCVPSLIYLTPVSLQKIYKCVGTYVFTFHFLCQMLW